MRIVVLVLLALAACKSRPTEKARTGPLITRVEGQEGLRRLVAALAAELPRNQAVGGKFAATDWTRFRAALEAYLCEAVGGPCQFEGELADALGVQLADDELAAFMEAFIAAMNQVALPENEQNELIDILMRGQG